MTIQHTVVFRLVHGTGSAAEAQFLSDARRILTAVPGVTEFAVNRQVNPMSGLAWQFSMLFTDQAAYDAYTVHPDHVAFTTSRWKSEVAAFQEYDFVAV